MIIPFGEWMPDQADLGSNTDVTNAAPAAQGYRSFPGLTVYSTALTARCQGAYSFQDADGNTHTFSGDASNFIVSLLLPQQTTQFLAGIA